MTQAFLPLLTRSRGAIVNALSRDGPGPLPDHSGLLDFKGGCVLADTITTRSFGRRGVSVHAVLTGPVDTDMSRDLDIPKASAESVARAIFAGVENGDEEIFPDPMSASMAESWLGGAAKAMERQNASLTPLNGAW